MEGLLATIQDALEKSKGPGKYLPVFEVRALEGVFGAGPGDDMKWDNRFDLGLQARWNLGDFATAQTKARIAHSKLRQVHLTYQDLRAKLSAGVQEARESSLSGKEQIRLSADQLKHATESYRLSKLRLKENVRGSSPTEVLGTLQNLAQAQVSHLTAINAYDKAQLRLMLLLGPSACIAPIVPEVVPASKVEPAGVVVPAVWKPAAPASPYAPSLPRPNDPSAKPAPTPAAGRPPLDALKDAQTQFKSR
jgi:hypothetical protein